MSRVDFPGPLHSRSQDLWVKQSKMAATRIAHPPKVPEKVVMIPSQGFKLKLGRYQFFSNRSETSTIFTDIFLSFDI